MILNNAKVIYLGRTRASRAYFKNQIVWPPETDVKTMTGVPPFAFYTTGSALQNYVIRGASGGVGDTNITSGKYVIVIRVVQKNLCGYSGSRTGGYLNTDGTVQPQYPNNYRTSDFIRIPSGISKLTYSFWASGYPAERGVMVCAYDANKNFIGEPVNVSAALTGDTRYSYPFDVPSGTAFLRHSYVTDVYNPAMVSSDYNMQLEAGETATDYFNGNYYFNITLDAPLGSGDSYTFDGTVNIETMADAWNFLYVETSVPPENMTIYFDAEE